ncbi:hypothetical protein [Nonomuraea sp. WAC 01424]|jgi:predicted membrane channel-forming protein YqfA (hemolysin III family)|uniref:hypothetical protein n=1 Tax=Nonomuraea sp. WAC 01424 TaxID=2203200 RepID=UPI000F798933|nr:hypothetical protein [Nonomuraea sp. WAC 01424]
MGMRIAMVLLALAVAMIFGLFGGIWCLVRGEGVNRAMKAGAAVFVAMATLGVAIIAVLASG